MIRYELGDRACADTACMADRSSLHARRARDPDRFPAADHELTDDEIETVYGAFVGAALRAFRVDASYALAMHEGAERLDLRRRASRQAVETRRRERGC